MPVNVKIEKSKDSSLGKNYVARIMSGYNEGQFVRNCIDNPRTFGSVEQAEEWLEDTGYTVVGSPIFPQKN